MKIWLQIGQAPHVPYFGDAVAALGFAAELARRDGCRVTVAAGRARDRDLRVLGTFGSEQPYAGEAA